MRIKHLAFMASWVFLGAKADNDETGIETVFDQQNQRLVTGDNSSSQLSYTIMKADIATTSLYLIQATYNNSAELPIRMKAGKVLDFCIIRSSEETKAPCGVASVTVGVKQTVDYDLATPVFAQAMEDRTFSYSYLFCFINAAGHCASSSISRGLTIPGVTRPEGEIVLPEEVVPAILGQLPTTPGNISTIPIQPSTTAPDEAAKTIIGATVSLLSGPASTNSPSLAPTISPSSKGGLSIGAKVGIAVGAVVIVLGILILALLFLRKKHRQRSNKERLILNQSLNADSRDLITEKEITPTSYQIPNLNFASPGSPASETRHLSVLSPYDPVSQPYTGSAASIPRRKATLSTASASVVGTAAIPQEPVAATMPISREVSRASSHLPPTRSIGASEPTSQPQNYEQYHDVPSYGHGPPQVFQGGLQAPFLSETDSERGGSVALTEADHARLAEEEEERRIDAAIAESERLKHAHGR